LVVVVEVVVVVVVVVEVAVASHCKGMAYLGGYEPECCVNPSSLAHAFASSGCTAT
jgi:hypothetical protein